MQNPLDRHPRIRQFAFDIQWVANLVMAVLAFVLSSMEISPLWFLILAGSLNIIWSYLGLTARGNVTGTDAVGMPLTTTEEP